MLSMANLRQPWHREMGSVSQSPSKTIQIQGFGFTSRGDFCNSCIGTLLPKFKPNMDSNPSLTFQAKRKGHDRIRRHGENARKKSRMSHLISLTPGWKTLVASLIWISLQLLSLPC